MRIAIIGSGGSGLSCIKTCVEGGLEPVCFERTDHMGGLWYYTDNPISGQASVMKTTVMNTSKEIMAFGDFPPPAEWPPFLKHERILEYYRLYMNHFDLEKYIRYNTETVFIKKAKNYSTTGQWEVTLKDLNTQKEWTEIFDGVMAATGHHALPHKPPFPGQENFKGQILHSHDIRDPNKYLNKRIVVIGTGNSGGDCAVELSYRNQIYLSTRNGMWIYNRVVVNGTPADMNLQKRIWWYFINLGWLAHMMFWKFVEHSLSIAVDHTTYGIRPSYGPGQEHPMVNDAMPLRIATGSIVVKTGIKRFTETGVEFTDGSSVDNIDIIIKATGYHIDFPYIDRNVIDIKNNKFPMYKLIFPPDLEHPTLALIGCFQPRGSIPCISEIQARVAVEAFKGVIKLPSREDMYKDIEDRIQWMEKGLQRSLRHTVNVDAVPYMDELSDMIGAKPNIWKLMFTDPVLAFSIFFDTTTAYQYRLVGPNAWPGAREATLNQWKRTMGGLKHREVPEKTDQVLKNEHYILLLIMMVAALIYKLFSAC